MNRREPHFAPRDPVVGGVLVRLSNDDASRDAALAMLAAHPALTLGEAVGDWWTLAVEAENASEGRDLHAWMATVPGVDWVEVVSVHFEGMAEEASPNPAVEIMP
jgi:hypothetical protein